MVDERLGLGSTWVRHKHGLIKLSGGQAKKEGGMKLIVFIRIKPVCFSVGIVFSIKSLVGAQKGGAGGGVSYLGANSDGSFGRENYTVIRAFFVNQSPQFKIPIQPESQIGICNPA
jgi:hypothetical protein